MKIFIFGIYQNGRTKYIVKFLLIDFQFYSGFCILTELTQIYHIKLDLLIFISIPQTPESVVSNINRASHKFNPDFSHYLDRLSSLRKVILTRLPVGSASQDYPY